MKCALIIAGWIFFTFTPKLGMQKSPVFYTENDCVSAQGLVQHFMFKTPVAPGELNVGQRSFVTQCLQGS